MLTIEKNPEAPHTAVISFAYQIMEKKPTGELTGNSVESKTILLKIDGISLVETRLRVENLLDKVREDMLQCSE